MSEIVLNTDDMPLGSLRRRDLKNLRLYAESVEGAHCYGAADPIRYLADQIEQQTRPPKPPEPQGLGAVVEDAAGEPWVRVELASNERRWFNPVTGQWRAWCEVNAVRELAPGWSE